MIEKTERCDGGCDKVLTSVRDEIYEPAVRIIIAGRSNLTMDGIDGIYCLNCAIDELYIALKKIKDAVPEPKKRILATFNLGERMGAFLQVNYKLVEFLGYGVYDGEHIPYGAVGGYATWLREYKITDSRMKLDNGELVYRCECWITTERDAERMLEEYKKKGALIVSVDIDKHRKGELSKEIQNGKTNKRKNKAS